MIPMDFDHFDAALFEFLEALSANNNREWFTEHKAEYERLVQGPALGFIAAMIPHIAAISPNLEANPSKVGGSLMRVYRDTRFSADKTPYKTNVGIQFRHSRGKDVHAPGLYLHIAPDECFLGVGIWHPDPPSLARLRGHLLAHPSRWIAARDHAPFAQHFKLMGDSVSRPPRGFDKDHALIEDLKRRDFIAGKELGRDFLLAPALPPRVAALFETCTPLMGFLSEALELEY